MNCALLLSEIRTPSQDQETIQSQTSSCLLDCLYCEEEQITWNDDQLEEEEEEEEEIFCVDDPQDSRLLEDQLAALLAKEGKPHLSESAVTASQALMLARREALEWMMKVNSHFGFSTITLLLAVNYFDRFVLRIELQKDRPWMFQLVSVACLSLASKIEETQVPPLLDIQVDCKYVFEAKTIQRVELLVLSTLQWRMYPVTPFCYLENLIRRDGCSIHLRRKIISKFEALILSVLADPRFLCYPPSVMAAALILHVIEHQIHLIDSLRISKDKVDECYRFIQEVVSNKGQENERTRSRAWVIDMEPPVKKSRWDGFEFEYAH